MEKIQELAMAMIRYNNAAPNRIQHTTKEHAYAAMIGHGEGLDEDTPFIHESAALVHDIGIRASEKKYGYQNIFRIKSNCQAHNPERFPKESRRNIL